MVARSPGQGRNVGGPGAPGAPRKFQTTHRVHFADARDLRRLASRSVELVVTSPPYPMIEMWDASFAEQDPEVRRELEAGEGWRAFERMHALLDRTWKEVHRVLVPGGIACINIGDATRTIRGCFVLYPNHMRILRRLVDLGLSPLPAILWRKQTNAPTKFMGSGMFPPGAYVTLEHEYVLVVRKGDKRLFGTEAERARRRESAFFWEERNAWFSDVWFDLKGAGQELLDSRSRERSGAFPFELPYRLISMFSLKGDTVLDPFLGTGTTMLAAMAAGRNSVGFERDASFEKEIAARARGIVAAAGARLRERLESHVKFIRARFEKQGGFRYRNRPYGFPVVTNQEKDLFLSPLLAVRADAGCAFEAKHGGAPPVEAGDWTSFIVDGATKPPPVARRTAARLEPRQLDLFPPSDDLHGPKEF